MHDDTMDGAVSPSGLSGRGCGAPMAAVLALCGGADWKQGFGGVPAVYVDPARASGICL